MNTSNQIGRIDVTAKTFATKANFFLQCSSLFLHASISSLLNKESMAVPQPEHCSRGAKFLSEEAKKIAANIISYRRFNVWGAKFLFGVRHPPGPP